jgi:hypothetical protein
VAVAGILHDEIGVGGIRDGAAMRENDDVRIDAERGLRPGVDARGAILQLERGLRADGAAGGQAEVTDNDVGARDRHGGGFLFAEDIGRRQHVLLMRHRDHLDLQRVGHAGLFEIGAEDAVDQADGRKILHARKAERLQLIEEEVHVAEGICAVDAGEHRRLRDDR